MARKVSGGWMVLCCLIVALENAALCQGGSSEHSLQDCSQDDRITLLYQKLEGALINNSKALFQLKKTFFSVSGTHIQEVEILHLHVCVRVGVTGHFQSLGTSANSSNGTYKSTHCWDFQWSASAFLSFITVDELMTIDFMYVNFVYSRIQGSIRNHNLSITLNTKSDSFPCTHIPSENDLKEVLIQLLSWAKAYARAQGKPQTWEERDKGYLTLWYNYWTAVREGSEFKKTHQIHIILIVLYISLNIFILLVFMIAGNQCQRKLTDLSSKQSSHIYMTAVLIGITLFNTLYVLSIVYAVIYGYPKVWATMKGSWASNNPPIPTGTRLYKDEEITLIIKYITLPVTVIIELFLAVETCCCSCRCCSETLIWWNAMVFTQILVGQVTIPAVILFIIAPAITISIIGTVALVYICLLIVIVCLVHIIKHHCSRKMCRRACAELLGLVVFLALLASLVAFYFEVLQTGSNLTSIKGFIITLLPSVVASLTVWRIKKLLSHGRHDKILKMMCIKEDRSHDGEMEEGSAEERRCLLPKSA